MNKLLLSLSIIFLGLFSAQSQPDHLYQETTTIASEVHASMSNFGIIGTGFKLGNSNPSFEFPKNSGTEHIYSGGFWVGGISNDSVFVSTSAADNVSGFKAGDNDFEFTSFDSLRYRSIQPSSPYYDSMAVSDGDLITHFSDTSTSIMANGTSLPIDEHTRPLGVAIEMETYTWNQFEFDQFLIFNLKIKHIGPEKIDSLHIGLWADALVRNINVTPPGSGGASFYAQGGNGFIDSLSMAYEFDANGDIGFTDSYIGLTYLGAWNENTCSGAASGNTHLNSWIFNNFADPDFFSPSNDQAKFTKMTNGMEDRSNWLSLETVLNQPGNRSILVSSGSLGALEPGDSLQVAFAIICARSTEDGNPVSQNTIVQRTELVEHAQRAKALFYGEDHNRNCLLDPGEDVNGDGKISRFSLDFLLSEESDFESKIAIFPNPTQETLQIESEWMIDEIQLFDLQGRAVDIRWRKEGNSYQGNVSEVSRGNYLLKISTQGQVITRLLMIE